MATPKPYSELAPLQRLWFLVVARSDFLQAAHAADAAIGFKGDKNVDMRFVATEAAIVRFARPFLRCVIPQVRPHGAPPAPQLSTRLTPEFIPAEIPGGDTVLQAVLKRRHTLIAHNEIELKPMQVTRRLTSSGPKWELGTLLQEVSSYNLEQLARVARALADKAAEEAAPLADQLFPMVKIGQSALIQFEREGRPPIIT